VLFFVPSSIALIRSIINNNLNEIDYQPSVIRVGWYLTRAATGTNQRSPIIERPHRHRHRRRRRPSFIDERCAWFVCRSLPPPPQQPLH